MNIKINRTREGLKKYPMHSHSYYEIMLYLSGDGHLRTPEKDYPFSRGTIIIVPPNTKHGSVSEKGFKNISIGGDFSHLFYFKNTVVLKDNSEKEGTLLANIIYNNRFKDSAYLSAVCSAFIQFILHNLNLEDDIGSAVNDLVSNITQNFNDSNINLKQLLINSGYAEDYIRAQFKKITGKTPNAFLTEIRITHACFLIDIYKNTYSFAEIAEKCGYVDYSYFSRKFKSVVGKSPQAYVKNS